MGRAAPACISEMEICEPEMRRAAVLPAPARSCEDSGMLRGQPRRPSVVVVRPFY